jgi:secreted PhoX family phosphatase
VLAANSELNGNGGGASAIRFDAAGRAQDAYRILGGTKWNCAGGAMPWGTWLSCEEFRNGLVWECDPFGVEPAVARPGLGTYPHEAAPYHPAAGHVYLTEDDHDGRLYRFEPAVPEDLGAGALFAASVAADGSVTWVPASPKRPYRGSDSTAFDRAEGAIISRDFLYFSTTADDRIWALDLTAQKIAVIYDGLGADAADALHDPDAVGVHERTGHLYVGEDEDDIQLVQLVNSGSGWLTAPFLQFAGHGGSEVTGPTFSPDGSRLYVSSQRGTDGAGLTFEITGPFAGS